MFDRLYLLVKENLRVEIMDYAQIPAQFHDNIINEASGTIIDVLKSHIEIGRYQDLWSAFMFSCAYKARLITIISNKYALRLNKYYGVAVDKAKNMAQEVIPTVLDKYVSLYKTEDDKTGKGIFALFNILSGNKMNYECFLGKITPPIQPS